MVSPSPTRFDDQEEDEYQSAEDAIETLPDSESDGYELELESMTGKGIDRLCSELLELKKASDEDFQKNIYSNYSAFLRIFEEVGSIESEIMKMKNHVATQKMLVKELMNSFHAEIILENLETMKDECVEDLDLEFPSWLETRMQNILETLDILMSERRMEEALVVLEKETQALQKLRKEKDCLSPSISSFACAISDWRARLVQQFDSLAVHKRVTWPELHNALFGLCRLDKSERASILLLNFFHLQLENSVNELKFSAPFPYGTYTLELAKVVFSTIFQAARSFVLLFGEASPYNSNFMQWARVKLEVICNNFDMYAKSISETSLALGLAVEIMNISFSFCSILEHETLSLQPDMMKLMKPCITEVLQRHFDHLRKVVNLFATTDNCVLGKFLIPEKLSNKSSLQKFNGKLECRQLTSSGRKFITLVQLVLDEAFPLYAFHLEDLILKGLADLFDEYTLTLERAITIRVHVEECEFPTTISASKFQQQISILVNSSELVHLLPTIVQNSFNATIFSSDVVLPEQDKLSSPKTFDLLKLAIQEASDRLKSCFCQLFVSGITSHENSESMKDLDTCSCGRCVPGSSEDSMPSFVLQELFFLLRHLEEQFESIILVEDGMMYGLLNEIMMTVIFWLSENLEFLKNTKSHRKLLLDMHFLMEIARAGGYFSDNLMVAALDLMAIMKVDFSTKEFHLNSEIPEEGWATNAAKLAIKTLLEGDVAETESNYNPMVDCFNKYTEDNHERMQGGMDGSKLNEDEFLHSMGDSTRLNTQVKVTPLQNKITGVIDFIYDDEGSRSPTICNSCLEDEQAAAVTDTISDRLSETFSLDDLDVEDFIIISAEESGRDSDLGTTAALSEIGELTGIDESKSNRVEIQLLGVLENLEPDGNSERQDGSVNVFNLADSDVKDFAQVNGSLSDAHTGEAMPVLQTDDMISCAEVANACHLVATEGGFQYDSCNGAGEMSHSEEKIASKENDQADRSEAEHEMNTGEVQHFEGNLLARNDKDLSRERISNDECGGADPIARARYSRRYLLETNGGQERLIHAKAVDKYKHSKVTERLKHGQAQAADGVGKNKKGRTTRPQWQ